MMEAEYTSFGILVLLISLLGYILENIWLAATKGYCDNRNMYLPFLLGYGLLVVGMYLIMGTPDDIVFFGKIPYKGNDRQMYYLLAVIIVSIGEIALGTLVEKSFGFEYWNYSWIPLHITKYTSVPTSLGFGAIITLFMDRIFTPVLAWAHQIYTPMLSFIIKLLLTACFADMIISFIKMYRSGGQNRLWCFCVRRRRDSHRRLCRLSGRLRHESSTGAF
ncbi:MAG: putative ABC transporter permease [Lachnospiraceae bacterium]|nr:putative ABC transporter permease [Lachnospiraceae bacterium]